MTEAVQVQGLKKSYGTHSVLKGLDFGVNQGEIFGILGVNGAGKTTAMECIEGLRTYDAGRILVRGKTGIQLQSASLPEHIRAMEAIRLFAKWNHCEPDAGMLTELGIPEFAKKQYYQLSTGQKRRLHGSAHRCSAFSCGNLWKQYPAGLQSQRGSGVAWFPDDGALRVCPSVLYECDSYVCGTAVF